MMDEFFDRQYQAGRAGLNADLERGFRRLGSAIGNAFAVLHRVQFAAPWAPRSKRVRFR